MMLVAIAVWTLGVPALIVALAYRKGRRRPRPVVAPRTIADSGLAHTRVRHATQHRTRVIRPRRSAAPPVRRSRGPAYCSQAPLAQHVRDRPQQDLDI